MAYALITGASKGIGKTIAEELASKKFDILLIARTENTLQEVAAAISTKYNVKADYLPIDLSTTNAAQNIFNWCKEKNYAVQVLVNNAGYGLSGAIEKYTVEENNQMINVNINSLVSLCHLFYRY